MFLMQAGDSPIVNDAIDLATILHRLGLQQVVRINPRVHGYLGCIPS